MHFICRLKQLVLLFIFSGTMISTQAAPIGGQVTAGTGHISQSGNTTTINQQSQNLSLNWNKFDIAPKETVNFAQPNTQSLAVNRVLGSNQASQIQGHLNANGQVWLINPNGVVFGKNSTVNVGGLLASTLDIADSELNKSQRQFSGSGTGSIINKGNIQAVKGGYVAMIANTVSNQGRITTPQGTTALAAGSQVTVTFAENQLTGIRVDKSTLNNLVENKQIIRANGGAVIMTAGAHDSLLSSAVNNSGIVEAQTLSKHKGEIILLGGMEAGTTTISGTLDASAPNGGKGGSIETSAAQVKISPEAKITTKSSQGMAGTWTIDPQDYTIAASGGDITGSQLSNLLASNNIIISSDQGQAAGNGDLNVNNAISWSNTNSLTLNAVRNVNFNSGGAVSNTAGGTLNVRADSGATGVGTIVMNGGSIKLSGTGGAINFYYNPTTFGTPSTFTNVTAGTGASFTPYMLIYTPANFAAMATHNGTKNYALGTNLDLSSIANFTPINFSGKFDGQNYSITNLKITGANNNVGLFSRINVGAIVKNMILSGVNVSGASTVGALAGTNNGTVSNITISGTVSATGNTVGGVFGLANIGSAGSYITSSVDVSATGNNSISNYTGGLVGNLVGGTYSNDSVTGSVTTGEHNYYIGGFAGHNNGTIKQSSFNGTMTTPYDGYTGGFVGYTDASSSIRLSYTTATINAGDYGYDSNGGFAGVNYGTIDSSYSSGNVILGQSWNSGGFVGTNYNNISNSYSTGNFTITPGPVPGGDGAQALIQNYGGLVGYNASGKLTNDYATGSVNAIGTAINPVFRVGGLVGFLVGGSVSHSYASGNVIAVGANSSFGGLIGHTAAPVSDVYASGNVSAKATTGTGVAPSNIAGLIGYICGSGSLANGYSIGNVSASTGATNVGGLVGLMIGTISGKSFWDTTTSGQASSAGNANIVGMPSAQMQTQTNFTSATAANGNVNPNWNFDGVWGMGSDNYLYPVFNPANEPVATPGPTPLPISTSYYPLTLSKLSASDKVYDSTTVASVTGALSGMLPGNTVSVSSLSGAFNNKNVGTAKPVTVTQPTLTGADAGKYLLVRVSLTHPIASITPRDIDVTATGVDKVYDGAVGGIVAYNSKDILPGDSINFGSTATFIDKNVGITKPVTIKNIHIDGIDGGNYRVNNPDAISVASITQRVIDVTAMGVDKVYDGTPAAQVKLSGSNVISGEDIHFTNIVAQFSDKNVGTDKSVTMKNIGIDGTDSANYRVDNSDVSTVASITPRGIAVTAAGVDKVYDGTPAAQVKLAGSNVIAGDDIGFNDIMAQFSDKNVGAGKPVTIKSIGVGGTDGANYVVNNPDVSTLASITPRAIDVTVKGVDKVYDGTSAATATYSSKDIVPGDSVNFSSIVNFSGKNVGTNKPVSISDLHISGIDSHNYSVNHCKSSSVASITPRGITVAATGVDKVYDGTPTAQVELAGSNVIAGEDVSFTDIVARFSDKKVGTKKPVTMKNIGIGGTDSANYRVSNPDVSTVASITPRSIDVTAAGVDKAYDGTPAAQVKLESNDIIPGDNVSFADTVAQFSDKNVGTKKPVTIKNIGIGGNYIGGVDGANYVISNPEVSTLASITPLNIDVTATGVDKVYDGSPAAQVKLESSKIIPGDDISFVKGASTFVDKNAGANKTVNVNDIRVKGTDGNNYSINNHSANTAANITPRGINVAATGMDKTYDGTPTAQVTLKGSDVLPGDSVNLNGIASFIDKNVETGKPVTIKNIGVGGADGSNYVVTNPNVSTVASITPLGIDVAATGMDKIYDRTPAAQVTLASDGVLPGDKVNFVADTANFVDKNAGTNKVVKVSDIRIGGADKGNYQVNNPKASTVASIVPLNIDVTATGVDKVYDGTPTGVINYRSADILPGDSVDFGGIVTFVDKNVGTDKPVTINDIHTGGIDGSNYIVNNPSTSTTVNITPLNITATVTATGVDKIYDGTPAAQVKLESSKIIPGDDVSFVKGAATFVDKNVGTDKPIRIKDIRVSGTDGGNYYAVDIPEMNTTASITPRNIAVTATGVDKAYDGTPAAQVALKGGNIIAGDNVGLTKGVATFVDKNVGVNKTVNINDLRVEGTDSANYTVNNPAVSTIASITPRGIAVTATGMDKTYDGTPAAQVTLAGSNVITGDDVNFTDVVAQFSDKKVGTDKPITVKNIAVGGTDASNYLVNNPNVSTIASITPRGIAVTAAGVDKIYDGTRTGAINYSSADILPADNVNFSGIANFVDKNVGLDKRVAVKDIRVSGTDSANYVVNNPDMSTVASIRPRGIDVIATGVDKTYDGTPTGVIHYSSKDILPGDSVDFGGTANFVDKNAGMDRPVTIQDIHTDGIDGGNYIVNDPSANTTASITPLNITATITAKGVDKVYDGNPAAQVKLESSKIIPGDDIGFVKGTATFADKNAGADKPVTIKHIRVSGIDSGNYAIDIPDIGTTASITPRSIAVTATGMDKVYDGTPAAQVKLTGSNVIAGDDIGFTDIMAQFSDKNVGTEKPVTIKNIAVGGTDSANYVVSNPDVSTVARITPRGVNMTASGVDKVYDGTRAGTANYSTKDIVPGDKVNFSGTVNFAGKNVGTNKPVSVSDIRISGIDGNNYNVNNRNTSTTASITPRGIDVTATGVDKPYDGTPTGVINYSSPDIVPGDSVNFGGIANFVDKNVGLDMPITINDIRTGGIDGGNYIVNNPSASTTASIIPLNIATNVTATGVDKIYDGTPAAQVKLESNTIIPGDDVSFANGSASFVDKNAGSNKPVTIKDIRASGADSGNYAINIPEMSTTATIAPRSIDVTASGVDKAYDGTPAAQVKLASSKIIPSDDIRFVNGPATFVDKNAGANKAVNVNDIRVKGTDGNNYSINNHSANTVANITPRGITVTATGANKTYDGTPTAQVTLQGSDVLPGDDVNFNGIGRFVDKNAAAKKPVTIKEIRIGGIDSGNYVVSNPNVSTIASITPRGIDVAATGRDKVYDRTPAAQVTLTSEGVLPDDKVNFVTDSANFVDKHAGTNKAVKVGDIRVEGADKANYQVSNPKVSTVATIVPLHVNVIATAADKVYDGTPAAKVKLISNEVFPGDSIYFSGTGSFEDKNIGTNKLVNVTDIHVGGADSHNYIANNCKLCVTASITPRDIHATVADMQDKQSSTKIAKVRLTR